MKREYNLIPVLVITMAIITVVVYFTAPTKPQYLELQPCFNEVPRTALRQMQTGETCLLLQEARLNGVFIVKPGKESIITCEEGCFLAPTE